MLDFIKDLFGAVCLFATLYMLVVMAGVMA